MELSDRAIEYIATLKRNDDLIIPDKQSIIDYMIGQGIQPYEKIIQFQLDFSGLELTISGEPDYTFQAALFSKKELQKNQPISVEEIDGKLYFDCGGHSVAQFWFVIGIEGEICVYDDMTGTINPIFSCFEKFIE